MHELNTAKNRKAAEGLGKVEARLLAEGGFRLAPRTPLVKTRFGALKHERWIGNSECFVTPYRFVKLCRTQPARLLVPILHLQKRSLLMQVERVVPGGPSIFEAHLYVVKFVPEIQQWVISNPG